MEIIKCNRAQLEVVKELAYAIWPTAYGEILSKEQLTYMLERFYNLDTLQLQAEKGQQFYLAQDMQQDYIGFVAYEINCEPNKTKIHKIYVLPETQGSGVGKQLFEFVKNKAKEQHQKAIFLNVNKYNKAQYFYTKLGLKITKEEVIDIGNKYIMDDYVMEVNL
ncbi:GNAT family N-acetyltransferase [Flavobacterium ardleyense]|uniref:GNAT family N-acetyltransferase n=1 Tax=Flavobacterium ardleyense TaxID=2038737 RepID=A0ABW5ZBW4_9FLAO